MPDSRAARLAVGAHRWARLGIGLMVVGPSVLLVAAWVEVLNHPGSTLVDGYWIGRVPWTPLGLLIALTGTVIGLLAGSLAILVEGGWWRRVLVLPALAAAALWWLTAMGVIPYPRFHGPNPVTFAFTLPSATALLLLMPATLLAILCLTPRGVSAPRTRMRKVPHREPWSEPPPEGEP